MTKTGGEKVQSAAMGHNKSTLQKHIDGIIDDERKIATLKASLSLKYKKVDDDGFDPKEVKFMVKNNTKPMPVEFKRGVNNMCALLGQQLIFDLPVIVDKKEVPKGEKVA